MTENNKIDAPEEFIEEFFNDKAKIKKTLEAATRFHEFMSAEIKVANVTTLEEMDKFFTSYMIMLNGLFVFPFSDGDALKKVAAISMLKDMNNRAFQTIVRRTLYGVAEHIDVKANEAIKTFAEQEKEEKKNGH